MTSLTKSSPNSSRGGGPPAGAAPRPPPPAFVCPAGITTIIGFALPDAIRLSRMKFGAADRRPRIVAIPGAVQQVEDRVLVLAGFIARRRVDVHAPRAPERGGVIEDLRDGAVRDVLGVHHVRARHGGDAPRRGVRFADRRVARIDHADAVDDVDIAIGPRLDGAGGHLPDAVRRLGELRLARAGAGISPPRSARSSHRAR